MFRSRELPVEGGEVPSWGRNYWAISVRRLLANKVGVVCLSIILLFYGAGVLAPLVTPYGYNDQDLTNVKQSPSLSHPFGTDRLGRDNFSRVIYGLRTTVILTVVTLTTGSLALGITLGLIAGYVGGKVDSVIMRAGEVSTSFPELFLVLILIYTLRPPLVEWLRGVEDFLGVKIIALGIADYFALALALAIFSWFGMARLVRGQVLQAREEEYVAAARSIGARTPRLLFRHVFPNVMGPVIVSVSASLGTVAGAELLLSFLGIGIQPPVPSLGRMIFENGSISVLQTSPHLLGFPVLAITVLLFAFSLLGDAVNDAFNPRAR